MKWSEVAQSCLTLCDPMDCSPPGSSVHGIFQAWILEWVAVSFSRGSSWLRNRIRVSCIIGRRFTIWATRLRELLKWDWYPYQKRHQGGSVQPTHVQARVHCGRAHIHTHIHTHTPPEERPHEDTKGRWPSASQAESVIRSRINWNFYPGLSAFRTVRTLITVV